MDFSDSHKTKIIATVGPASDSEEMLIEMVKRGVQVFRLNFSHGNHANHERVIKLIHTINDTYNKNIGILADLQGPKIRIGKIENNLVKFKAGDRFKMVNKECIGNHEKIYINYKNFPNDVREGEKILLDDGKVVLKVISSNQVDSVEMESEYDCELSSNKGVNLPDTQVSIPSITEKDYADLAFILQHEVHWIALSFVRSSKEIRQLKKMIAKANHCAKVIAKIEKPEAVRKIKSIIRDTDAIMVARGDLGIEVPMEKVPIIQKSIIHRCIQKSKPVIVATQMMDSMIHNVSPTRAEVTDVANAVFDGADAVMLSGETSVGKYPLETIESMSRIIVEAEKNYSTQSKRPKPDSKRETFLSDIICFNAAKTADDINAKAIVAMTVSGYTGYKISSYRPNSKIIIMAHQRSTLCILNLVWGVRGFFYQKFTTTDETIDDAVAILKRKRIVRKNDTVVNCGSMPIQKRLRTNFLKVTIVE